KNPADLRTVVSPEREVGPRQVLPGLVVRLEGGSPGFDQTEQTMAGLAAIESALGALELKHGQATVQGPPVFLQVLVQASDLGRRGCLLIGALGLFFGIADLGFAKPTLLAGVQQRQHGYDYESRRQKAGRRRDNTIAAAPHAKSRHSPN